MIKPGKPDKADDAASVVLPATEIVRLIERGQAVGQVPTVYWRENDEDVRFGGDWTEDPFAATRYATVAEAEEAATRFYFRPSPGQQPSFRVVEHIFYGADHAA